MGLGACPLCDLEPGAQLLELEGVGIPLRGELRDLFPEPVDLPLPDAQCRLQRLGFARGPREAFAAAAKFLLPLTQLPPCAAQLLGEGEMAAAQCRLRLREPCKLHFQRPPLAALRLELCGKLRRGVLERPPFRHGCGELAGEGGACTQRRLELGAPCLLFPLREFPPAPQLRKLRLEPREALAAAREAALQSGNPRGLMPQRIESLACGLHFHPGGEPRRLEQRPRALALGDEPTRHLPSKRERQQQRNEQEKPPSPAAAAFPCGDLPLEIAARIGHGPNSRIGAPAP